MPEASVLRLSVVHEQRFTLLYAVGEIDITTAPRLREWLDELTGDVVVDLADVTFLESQGLAVLAAAQKRLLDSDKELRLRNPQGSVRRALQLVGIEGWIENFSVPQPVGHDVGLVDEQVLELARADGAVALLP